MSSSYAPSPKSYDVFISFRGEDTRNNFTSHLYSELSRDNLRTFIDDDSLEKGEEVWPALSEAIEDSDIAVIVFSKNYASSKWCLEELVKILRCRNDERHRQVVIPVFYNVDPSHIRNQTDSYGEAFAKYERDLDDKDNESNKQKVSGWRDALKEAANIAGWDTRDKNEAQLIKKIVKDVLEKLEQRFPYELKVKDLVGIDNFCKDVELLLSKNENNMLMKNVQVIGIWGMPGLGKTTIAKAVFSQLFPQYDSVCFLENVREASQSSMPSKLASLRDKLLSELLKDENPKSNSGGSTFIMRRLSNKKVFVILDDVDSSDQLDILCRECNYAGPNSKLIITTRDRHLLRGRVLEDDIYKVESWRYEESLELFSLHAFKERYPRKGYEDLSKRAVEYAGGVPLALKVLGSNLSSRSTRFWESELEKLNDYPNEKIQNVLQVSYEGLHSLEKKIFLDIAFFFKDEYKDLVVRILDACGFHATSGIEVLEDKALITISASKRIQMHDLLHEMGLNIVRQCTEDPEKRSRLRDIEEVSDVLQNEKESNAVEGIKLDLSLIGDLHLNSNAFNMMTKLRFLKLYIPSGKRSGNVHYPGVLNKISNKLRYLEWDGYGLKSLPATFNAKMLVEIRMPHSHLTELWPGVKDVVNLEGIDLSECKQLMNIPDLSKASKLKWMNLSGCESLVDVHPSVLSLDTLENLILDNCKKLTSLKSEKHLRSLKNISVNGCTSLEEFLLSSDSMVSLDLSNVGIEKLHSSIGRSSNLKLLTLEGLRLKNLPSELSSLKSLEELRISNCLQLEIDKQKLHVLVDGLRSLRLLYLKDCSNLSELPDNIHVLSKLYELRLDGSSLETLPASIKDLNNLEILSLENCRKLWCLPKLPTYIKEFYAINCMSLVTVSTLKTFAEVMIGKRKYILFENCMKLDGPSLHRMMEGAQLAAMNAIFQNLLVRKYGVYTHSYNYNFVKACFPGSRIPEQFTYQTTESSFIIQLPSHSNMRGLILCAVLSPFDEMKQHGARIFCQCYLADGTKVGYATRWYSKAIWELNSDHVYIWYDAFHFDSIVRYYEQHVSFEFFVTNDLGERDAFNIRTKECGVRLILNSELHNLLRELDMDFESKRQLGLELASELGLELGSGLQLELESQHRESNL